MTNKPETIDDWIDRVNTEGRGLSEWQLGFMESITEQWEQKKWLSEKQEEILERIYANKTP